MRLWTFFLFIFAYGIFLVASTYLTKILTQSRVRGFIFFWATEGMILLTTLSTFVFIYLLSGLWSWQLVAIFLATSQLGVILGTVLNAALGSSPEKSRSRAKALGGEIGLKHPIIFITAISIAAVILLGYFVVGAVIHFRYPWNSQVLYVAAVKYTLLGMIFVPNIPVWGQVAAMLSSEELDENTRQQLLITQWAGILSYAPLISLALWAFGIGAGPLPATLASIASTFSARVTVIVLAFPILLFMLPYWIGTQRGNRFRVALAGKMLDFTAKLADLLRTPLPTSYIPALAALQAEVLAELTSTMQISPIMALHPANPNTPDPSFDAVKDAVADSQDLDPRFQHVDELIKFDAELQQIASDLTAQPPLRVIRAAERWGRKYEIRKTELGAEISSSSNARPVAILAVGTLLSALISSVLSDVGKTAWTAIASGAAHK
jgi:hypothetical protein